MSTLTAAPVKTITYDRKTRDYKMELDGEFVGYAACYHAAEVKLDRLAYEQLDRAGIEPELLQSATQLDAGSSVEAIAAEYAESFPFSVPTPLGECYICGAAAWTNTTNGPLCPDHAGVLAEAEYATALPVPMPEAVLSGFTPYAAHLLSNPGDLRSYLHARSIDELRALAQQLGVYQPSMRRRVVLIEAITPKCVLPSDDQPTDDPSHNLITPDPAECPDISAPQPVENLTTCERYSTAPSLALWGPDTPECPRCGRKHDPIVGCPKTVVAVAPSPEPEHDPCAEMRAALEDALEWWDNVPKTINHMRPAWVERARAALKG